jgi:hypothetical protein
MPGGFPAAEALAGRVVGVSVSNSPDLGRLGLTDSHLRLALGEIARAVFVAGGSLAYGGHLKAEGYTPFLVDEFMRWERPRPDDGEHRTGPQLVLCLAWTVQRRTPMSRIREFNRVLGAHGTVVCLTPDGEEDLSWREGRGEEPVAIADEQSPPALTGLRTWMTRHTYGRVLLGGKRRDFLGTYPGLMEEAQLALEVEQPVYLAGGFGGVTVDIIRSLGVDEGDLLLPAWGGEKDVDPRLRAGFERLEAQAAGRGWAALHNNGLTIDENRQLAATYRPSEIAALVSRGIGRLAGGTGDKPGPTG